MKNFRDGDVLIVDTKIERVKGMFKRRDGRSLFMRGTLGEEIKIPEKNIVGYVVVDRAELKYWGDLSGDFLRDLIRIEVAEKFGIAGILYTLGVKIDNIGIILSSYKYRIRVENGKYLGKNGLAVYNYPSRNPNWEPDGVRTMYRGGVMDYVAVREFVDQVYIDGWRIER